MRPGARSKPDVYPVVVVHDPTGEFLKGSRFGAASFVMALLQGYWPNFMEVQLYDYVVYWSAKKRHAFDPGIYIITGKRMYKK